MPVPIICLEAALGQFAEEFRAVFSRPQFQHFVTVLLGFIMAPEGAPCWACGGAWRAPAP